MADSFGGSGGGFSTSRGARLGSSRRDPREDERDDPLLDALDVLLGGSAEDPRDHAGQGELERAEEPGRRDRRVDVRADLPSRLAALDDPRDDGDRRLERLPRRPRPEGVRGARDLEDRKSTRLNSSHMSIS